MNYIIEKKPLNLEKTVFIEHVYLQIILRTALQ